MPQYSGMWTLSQVSQAVKNQTWTGNFPPSVVEYLVIAGGGSGGGNIGNTTLTGGGGGGAGGFLAGHVGITAGSSYTVTVGAGGTGSSSAQGTSGANSVFGSITSTGGGAGGIQSTAGPQLYVSGLSGGSGGGGSSDAVVDPGPGGFGINGQGNAGGTGTYTASVYGGGGGGGAGTVGSNGSSTVGGNGGGGIASSISGTVTAYAGGGGAGTYTSGTLGVGGVGGGGNAARGGTSGSGTVNTGGGGGGNGGTGTATAGGNGGSGIVIIRYPGTTQFFTGGTLSYANGYIVHTFYANGTLAPTTPTLYANPDYQISRSLRFNSADSAYLSRTPGSATNRKTFTWSGWVKRSALPAAGVPIFSTQGSPYSQYLCFGGTDMTALTTDALCFFSPVSGSAFSVQSASVYRDVSAWYHIVCAVDTTQTIEANRVRLYVNGSEVSYGTSTYPSQNLDTYINSTGLTSIGYTAATYFRGYITEVNFIDGQALTPSSFGWTNPATGVWAPLDFVGTYGTNGFNLNFSDNTNTTAATLGADSSGNGNNFTPNNFSVSAGVGNDSLVDTPTSYGTDTGVGGEVRGNYCTFSEIDKATTVTLTNGGLDLIGTGSGGRARASMAVSSGKWYFEFLMVAVDGGGYNGFMATTARADVTGGGGTTDLGQNADTWGIPNFAGGQARNNGTNGASITGITNGQIGMYALDMDSGKFWYGINGTWVNSGDPATGANPVYSNLSGYTIAAAIGHGVGTYISYTYNFGQRAFTYTAPSGYKAMTTQNLPTPTIGATAATLAGKYFNTVLWTGNDTARNITGVGFQPDWVWTKFRSAVSNHRLFDVLRGVEKPIYSSATTAEGTETGTLTAFISDGFSLGTNAETNLNGYTFAGWAWKAGGAGVTNTSGSITSSVSASPASGFSIVSFNSTSATGTATIGHGLGAVPSMIIMKNRAYYNWEIYHISSTSTSGRLLFTTSAKLTDANPWNQSAQPVTSSIFGYDQTWNNGSNDNIIAYCFAPIAGYSAFGSYTGNGSTNGPFVFTGFKPAFLMIKRTDAVSNAWLMYDGTRNTSNLTNKKLAVNLSGEENDIAQVGDDSVGIDFLSNGFKSVTQTGVNQNASGGSYIFAAFASTPFKYSLAR